MNILKNLFLLIIGSLLMNTNYAQCPIGETEITIQFIQEGWFPGETQWDYKIGGIISGLGPYTSANVVTICVPEGDLTIVGCETAYNSWYSAIIELRITEDGSVNSCTSQNGCKLYTSTYEDTQDINSCSGIFDYEVANIVIGACGETEVITTGCTNGEAINYDACAVTDDGTCMVPTLNNDCSNAKFIEIASINNYSILTDTVSLIHNSLNVTPTCTSAEQDAFYKFIVPSTGKIRFLSNQSVGISLLDSCNLNSIFCNSYDDIFEVDNLTPGDTLTLQIFDDNANYDVLFRLDEVVPTLNNNCANPQLINVAPLGECSSNRIISFLDFNSLDKKPDCDTYAIADSYYKIVVPNSGIIRYTSDAGFTGGFSLYKSCTADQIVCKDYFIEEIINDLTPGDTLIMQIFNQFEWNNFSFCIEEIKPSINNNCADALPITVAETGNCLNNMVSQSNLNYNTANIQPECRSAILHDSFYKFEVPSTGQILISSNYELGIAIYNTCDGGSIYCNDGVSNQSISNLPAGETVILQIYENYYERNFNFCLEEIGPSINNNCSNATPITVAEANNCESNTVELAKLYYNSADIQPECDSQIKYDAFYQFVVPASGKILFSSTEYVGISIYTSCENTAIFCDDQTSFEVVGNLPVGDLLLLQIFEYYSKPNLTFCLEEAIPTINDKCENATLITVAEPGNCNTYQVELSNLYNNSANIEPECTGAINHDAFYRIVTPQSGQIILSSNNDIDFALYYSCNGETIMCNSDYYFDIIRDLPKGDTIILQIFDTYLQTEISFCLENAMPTVNENCVDAIPIEVAQPGNCEMQKINLPNLYYNSTDIQPDCRDELSKDAFYEFVVPKSGNILFSSDENIGVSILNSCTGQSIYCDYYVNNELIRNLPVGETLILQIFSYYASFNINFCLEEVIASINNNCANAIPIEVAPSNECETYEVSISNFNFNSLDKQPFCDNEVLYDAFYEFTVPPSGQIEFSLNNRIGSSIYSSCNSQSLFCGNVQQDRIIRNLPAGENVILQIYDNYSSTDLSFCIKEVEKAVNNNCANAIPVTVAEIGNCEMHQVSLANLNYNTANIQPICKSDISYDVFYELLVPQTGQISFSSDNPVGIAIYQVCNSNSLFCIEYTQNEIIRNLPIGETVILQIFEYYSQPDFTFCLEEVTPAINNLCVNAEPFMVNEPGTCEGNFIRVTNSLNNTDVNPYCASYVMADAFYSFIVPSSGHVSISTSEQTVHGIAIYDDCLEQSFYCNDEFNNQVITNLNPNDTLILQVFQTAPFNFDLCLEDAPPTINNNCANATSLQIYNEGECEGNLVTAPIKNNSVNINPSCMYINADIFYKVTVPENGQFRVITDAYSTGLSVYTACDTNSLICKSSLSKNLIQGLSPNEEVLLQFFRGNNPSDFEFCIEKAIATTNNNCSNATLLNVSSAYDIFEQTDTINMNNNTTDIAPSCYTIDKDAFYSFTVPQNGKIVFYAINNFGMALYNNCNGESIFCDSYIDDQTIISDLPSGEELILQIFDRYGNYGDIKFSISEVVDNISCESATLICEPSVKGSNFGGTESLYMDGSECISNYSSINNAVWYSFTTDGSSDPVSIEIIKNECTYQYDDLYAQVLSNACSGEYVEEACLEIDGDKETMTLDNPLPNQQYYLRIGNESSYENCSFEINIAGGIEYNCCQLDYSLSTWCYYLNTKNYFVDVNVNDLGQNPSGYQVVGTNKRIIETGTTIIGPIPNGTTTLTLQGLDKTDCSITKPINFNCAQCEEHLLHSHISHSRNFDFTAEKTIESAIQVMPSATVNYSAGDSIMLKQGFTVEKGAEFSIDIEDCE